MIMPTLLALSHPGVIASLVVVLGGLAILFWWTLTGREVERRIIFLFIFIAVAAPVLFPITFEEKPAKIVRDLFDRIESLPPGSRVMISYDFDPAMAPEVHPMANAVVRHCFERHLRVVFISIWATGQTLLQQTLDRIVHGEYPDRQEGIDYVNLGYKAGNEGVMNVIVTNLAKMFPTDVRNIPLGQIPILSGVKSCKNLDLIISFGGGKPGPKEWILFVGDPANVPIGAGAAAVSSPELYAYYPRQLIGLLGGIKGAAEYEFALSEKYEKFKHTDTPAMIMMGPQTLAHIVIMAFIVLGNIVFFRKRKAEQS